jgi:hypothetical protein
MKKEKVTLYGVGWLMGKTPKISSVEAEQTARTYRVENGMISWLGYRNVIPKADPKVFLSPKSAVSAAIENREKRINNLLVSLDVAKEELTQLMNLLKEIE